MTITLTPEQLRWLEQQVASGRFESVEDAVQLAVSGLMAVDSDDLAWARPLVDQARGSIADGKGVSAEAVKAEVDAYLKSIGAR